MKASFTSTIIPLFLVIVSIQGALGEITCDDLPTKICAFVIASSGKRCVLEQDYQLNEAASGGERKYQCKTSEVVVEHMSNHIETDECINACGVDRMTVGISSDALLETKSVLKLCSQTCQGNCPNIVNLYSHLALEEGGDLVYMCEELQSNPRRALIVLGVDVEAPSPAPSSL